MVSHVRGMVVTLVALTGVAVSGCATTSALPGHGHHRRTTCAQSLDQGGPPADPSQVRVICRWANDLRSGNVVGAARTFHLPSVFADGEPPVTIHTLAQAEFINASLPCGARVISAFREGHLVNVLFALTSRAGRGGGSRACTGGAGQTARTVFLVRDGQIVQWLRAPSRPGDPGVPQSPTSTETGPSV